MFGSFAYEPRVCRSRREAWLAELKRDIARTVHPGDEAAVLCGDPGDGLALALGTMQWGLPNHAMAAKGLDPLDGALLFVPLAHASVISAHGSHCLVPLSSLTVHAPEGQRTYRDPDRPLLTLAALAEWVARPEATHRFGFLTERIDDGSVSYDAPMVVEPQHHDEWLDGWSKTEDLRSCGQPLRLGRMVVHEP